MCLCAWCDLRVGVFVYLVSGAIGEPYVCAFVDENNYVHAYERWIIKAYLILFIFLITIDVKLTPGGLWWTTYLFYEWVDGVQG